MTPDDTTPDRIVISTDDLDARPTMDLPPTAALPPLGAPPPNVPISFAMPTTPGGGLAKLGANTVVSGLLAGIAGGVVGMLISEIVQSTLTPSQFAENSELSLYTGLWIGAFGAVLAFALTAWDGMTSGSAAKAFRDGGIGAAIGLGAGFVGGFVAQTIYYELLKNVSPFAPESEVQGKLLLARVLGWAVFGAILGTGIGIPGGGRKVLNGLIGGTVGAAAGGLIFNRIEFASDGEVSEFALRFVGLLATGVGIGLAIGLVARIRRDAWLAVVGGPMAGKEFILYGAQTTLGSDYRSDIALVKDPSVWPEHARFIRDPHRGTTLQVPVGASTLVNGVPVQNHRLRPGDLVGIGASTLVFQERRAL